MNPSDRTDGTPPRARRWLVLCVFGALVVGAGGLLPSLVGDSAGPDATRRPVVQEPDAPSPGPSAAAMLARLAAGTVLVLALCAGTLPLARRWLAPGPVAAPGGVFDVMATLPLSGRCRVYLVRAGGQHLLAGADAGGLQVLIPVGEAPGGEAAPPAEPPARRAAAGIEPRRVGAA